MAIPSASLCDPSAPHRRYLVFITLYQCRHSADRLDRQQLVSSYQVWICPISTLKGSPEVCVGESVHDCGVHIMVRGRQDRCSVGRHNEQCWFRQAQPLGLLQPMQHLGSSASAMPLSSLLRLEALVSTWQHAVSKLTLLLQGCYRVALSEAMH